MNDSCERGKSEEKTEDTLYIITISFSNRDNLGSEISYFYRWVTTFIF